MAMMATAADRQEKAIETVRVDMHTMVKGLGQAQANEAGLQRLFLMKARIEDDYRAINAVLEEIEDTGGPLVPTDNVDNCPSFSKRKRIWDKLNRWVGPYHTKLAEVQVLAATLGEDVKSFNEDFYVATPS